MLFGEHAKSQVVLFFGLDIKNDLDKEVYNMLSIGFVEALRANNVVGEFAINTDSSKSYDFPSRSKYNVNILKTSGYDTSTFLKPQLSDLSIPVEELRKTFQENTEEMDARMAFYDDNLERKLLKIGSENSSGRNSTARNSSGRNSTARNSTVRNKAASSDNSCCCKCC